MIQINARISETRLARKSLFMNYSVRSGCMFTPKHPLQDYSKVSKCLRADSMFKQYLVEMLDMAVVLASLLSPNISENDSFTLSACLTPKDLPMKRKNLRYPFLASGVRPKRAKNTVARKGLTHSTQCIPNTSHVTVDHALFGKSTGSQSEWITVHPW